MRFDFQQSSPWQGRKAHCHQTRRKRSTKVNSNTCWYESRTLSSTYLFLAIRSCGDGPDIGAYEYTGSNESLECNDTLSNRKKNTNSATPKSPKHSDHHNDATNDSLNKSPTLILTSFFVLISTTVLYLLSSVVNWLIFCLILYVIKYTF